MRAPPTAPVSTAPATPGRHPEKSLAFDHTSRRLADLAADPVLGAGAGLHRRALHPAQALARAPPGLLDEAIGVSLGAPPTPEMVNQLEQHNHLGQVLAAGWRHQQQPALHRVRDARRHGGGRPRRRAPAGALPAALGTIASAAPLLGLFGTVIGMIEIFGSQAPTGSLSGGNPASWRTASPSRCTTPPSA
jgi:hypothetical protein